MSMTVGYKPYTGAINTNSARYIRAKAMYDEGHTNGESCLVCQHPIQLFLFFFCPALS